MNPPRRPLKNPKRFSTYTYIKNEFFNADEETLKEITDLYLKLYGHGPHKYLLDTYKYWKSGRISTSSQTMIRIIECVPRFLSNEKRFTILKNEVIYFTENLHQKQKNKQSSLSELNKLFENYTTQIENFNQSNLPYMVGKKIFTQEEIEEFLLVCKYIMVEKLNLAYGKVQNDINLLKEKFSQFNSSIFKASYKIDFFESTIDLSEINEFHFEFSKLKTKNLSLTGTYKECAEQYIFEEFSEMHFSAKEAELNHILKSNDLDLLLKQYQQYKLNQKEATLISNFKGEGGQLNLILEVKPLIKIKSLILYSCIRLAIYISILITASILVIEYELYNFLAIFVIVTIFATIFFTENFRSEIQKLKILKLELKNHGQ